VSKNAVPSAREATAVSVEAAAPPEAAVEPPGEVAAVMPSASESGTSRTGRKCDRESMAEVLEFQGKLTGTEEVGAQLVSFGNSKVFHVLDMGYIGPNIVIFFGKDENGQEVRLMQHHTQLNILFVAVKPSQEKPFRIGFDTSGTSGEVANPSGETI
jgi:hypothetical protein